MPDLQVVLDNSGDLALSDGAFEARIVFAPRRSQFVGVKYGTSLPDERRKDWGELQWNSSPVLLWVTWEKPLLRDQPLPLVVSYEGEPPLRLRIKLDDKIDKEVKALLRRDELPLGDAVNIRSQILKARVLKETPKMIMRFMDDRRDCIEKVTDPTRKAQMKFFFEYDIATNPVILDDKKEVDLAALIRASANTLRDRATRRAVPGKGKFPSLTKEVAQQLSDLQRAILTKHFGDVTKGTGRTEFIAAFTAFASRQLEPDPNSKCENDHWNGKPNSAYFFLFAEFAIQAYDLKVDRAFWRKTMPTFIQCQHIYEHVFPPFCDNPLPVKVVDREQRTFGMYGDAGPRQPKVDPIPLGEQLAGGYGAINTATMERLVKLHEQNAKRYFPRGDSGSVDPCNP